ncbi:MAG: hypothetical protein ACOYNI_10030 [Acidimicrobiia bacterium]
MRCERCGKATVVEIKMQVGEAELVFRRCGNCEEQRWEDHEGAVSLTDVLDLARAR